ncbi:MAG: EAL domain-containing protein [Xanthobacteraceae bacterium]
MIRLSAIFIGLCMGLIAGSVGAVLYLYLGMTGAEASIVALAAFTGLAVYNTISTRVRDRHDVGGQIADLSRGTADLARQVIDLSRRVAAAEAKAEKATVQAVEASRPLAGEIDELAGLVNQIAASVAAHDAALTAGFDATPVPVDPMFAEPAAPAAPATHPAVPPAAVLSARDEPAPAAATPPQAPLRVHEPAGSERAEPQSVQVPQARAPSGRFSGLDPNAIVALVTEAVEANRIELHLQPIVMLPQRKVRYYEALVRLRTRDGELMTPVDFLGHAEAGGLMPRIDNAMLFRCIQAVRRLMSNNREVGLFCNLSSATLVDPDSFREFTEFAEANRAIAPAFVFEFGQAAYRAMGPIEIESLGALASRGFRFSLDHVGDLRFEPRDLAERGFRFVKIPASLLLSRNAAAPADIHPADLAGLFNRYGISLIAEKIEHEAMVVDLLDYDVKLGQGLLFSPPRPVRPEILQPGNNRRDLSAAAADMPRARSVTPVVHGPGTRSEAAPTGLASPSSALAQLARNMMARK